MFPYFEALCDVFGLCIEGFCLLEDERYVDVMEGKQREEGVEEEGSEDSW